MYFSKLIHNELRLLSFHYGLSHSLGNPYVSLIEITNDCNFRCPMCPRSTSMTRGVEDMDFNLYKKIIGKLYPSNGIIYLHLLGEPLMHPDLDKMIRYGKSKGYEMGFFTNGSLLTEEKSMKIIDAGLDALTISFEIIEDTFNKMRKGGNFSLVRENIIRFLRLKNLKKQKRPLVTLSSITLTEDKEKLEKASRFWRGKVDVFQYKKIHEWTGDIPRITQITGIKKGYKYERKICLWPWTKMAVLVDGRVVPCCMDYDGKYVLGDLKQDSLKDIWNGEKMIRLRKALLEGRKEDIELCCKCTHGPEDKGTLTNRLYLPKRILKLVSRLVEQET